MGHRNGIYLNCSTKHSQLYTKTADIMLIYKLEKNKMRRKSKPVSCFTLLAPATVNSKYYQLKNSCTDSEEFHLYNSDIIFIIYLMFVFLILANAVMNKDFEMKKIVISITRKLLFIKIQMAIVWWKNRTVLAHDNHKYAIHIA